MDRPTLFALVTASIAAPTANDTSRAPSLHVNRARRIAEEIMHDYDTTKLAELESQLAALRALRHAHVSSQA